MPRLFTLLSAISLHTYLLDISRQTGINEAGSREFYQPIASQRTCTMQVVGASCLRHVKPSNGNPARATHVTYASQNCGFLRFSVTIRAAVKGKSLVCCKPRSHVVYQRHSKALCNNYPYRRQYYTLPPTPSLTPSAYNVPQMARVTIPRLASDSSLLK